MCMCVHVRVVCVPFCVVWVHVCVHVRAEYVHVCACIWRSEDNTGFQPHSGSFHYSLKQHGGELSIDLT